MGRYNEIVRQIEEETVAPIFWQSDDAVIGSDWAYGFAQAILLREKQWAEMMKSEAGMIMLPIVLLHEGEEMFDDLGFDCGEEQPSVDDTIDILPVTVIAIAQYWRMPASQRKEFTAELRAAAKVGRNDPCPCGWSGKKFKHCCRSAA